MRNLEVGKHASWIRNDSKRNINEKAPIEKMNWMLITISRKQKAFQGHHHWWLS